MDERKEKKHLNKIKMFKNKLTMRWLVVLCCGLVAAGCNNNFLEPVGKRPVVTDTLYITDLVTDTVFRVRIPGGSSELWKLVSRPHWLKLDNVQGVLKDGKLEFAAHRLEGEESNDFVARVNPVTLEVGGLGLVTIPVAYLRFGKPVIKYNYSNVRVSDDGASQFTFSNTGGGLWLWTVTQKPDWLVLSEESGVLYPNSNLVLTMHVDKSRLKSGGTGMIIINGNATARTIVLTIDNAQEELGFVNNILRVNGNIQTSEYNKATDNLMILTQSPNRLLLIGMLDNSIRSLPVEGVPTCATFSSDGRMVYVGKTISEIDVVDVNAQAVIQTIALDVDIRNMAYGDNGWLYVTTSVRNRALRSIHLATGKLYSTVRSTITSEKAIIKKAPGRKLLFTTNPFYSPSGLEVWDISNGPAKDSIDDYHVNAGDIWFTEDGDVMFLKEQNSAYFTPYFKGGSHFNVTSDLSLKGNFSVHPTGFTYLEVFDHNATKKDIWTGYNNAYTSCNIVRLDAITLSKKGNFTLKTIIDSASGKSYEPWVYWLFSSSKGEYLYCIKRTRPDYGHPVNWQVERVNVQ